MSSKRVSGKRNSLQRVHLEVTRSAAEPVELRIELALPDTYLKSPSGPRTPSWRDGPDDPMSPKNKISHREPGQPIEVSVIEIDLT